jgi:hypothetical protein
VRSWRTGVPMPLLTKLDVSSLPTVEALRPALRQPQIA